MNLATTKGLSKANLEYLTRDTARRKVKRSALVIYANLKAEPFPTWRPMHIAQLTGMEQAAADLGETEVADFIEWLLNRYDNNS